MTADDIALAILQDCPDATRIRGMRQKIAIAITQAEQRGYQLGQESPIENRPIAEYTEGMQNIVDRLEALATRLLPEKEEA